MLDTEFLTQRTKQLAISMVNKPGKLAAVCKVLADARINICALTVVETWGDNSTIRVVVDDPERALTSLEGAGLNALETDVLIVETENKPGTLAQIAEVLGNEEINIEYAYMAVGENSQRAWIILRPSRLEEAQALLS